MSDYRDDVNTSPVITVKEWLITLLIMCIPLVNIIMMFVWAFNGDNDSKSNYFKAALILTGIGIVLSVILSILIIFIFATYAHDMGIYYGL